MYSFRDGQLVSDKQLEDFYPRGSFLAFLSCLEFFIYKWGPKICSPSNLTYLVEVLFGHSYSHSKFAFLRRRHNIRANFLTF